MNARTPAIDVAAIGLSSLCLLHCLLLPLLAVSLPVAGVLSEMEVLHKAFVLMTLPLSAIAFIPLSNRPGRWALLGLALFGAICLVLGAFVEAFHDHEVLLTVVGALALCAAHGMRLFSRPHANRASGADG